MGVGVGDEGRGGGVGGVGVVVMTVHCGIFSIIYNCYEQTQRKQVVTTPTSTPMTDNGDRRQR